MMTVTTLRNALSIAEKIEQLEAELRSVLEAPDDPKPRKRMMKRSVSTEDLGHGLAPAVASVLRKARKPLKVREILDGLLSGGYKFTSKNPIKVLGARIYALRGVKKVGDGLFCPA